VIAAPAPGKLVLPSEANMADELGRWLVERGLGGHAEAFAANGVDWDILADLSERDLEALGLSLGDRKRLLRAIAALDGAMPLQRRPAEAGERRQITVMFVDLVDSTPLSERLDPEEMHEVLRGFHALCAKAVEANGGHIARYMGDGILVYFGYPQAHEDDAARAIHAGLGIVENLRAASRHPQQRAELRLQARIGIYTGLVVVGEVGAGPTRDRDAVTGETPNIASRLQAEAQPDTVVIGGATERLVDGLFALEDMGPRRLKGVSHDVHLYRVLGESDAVDRFDTRNRRGMTPLVGREAELEMLRHRWAQARDGEMRCVLLGGEAGIGKSRVLRALRDGMDESHEYVPLFCSPYHLNSAFWPVLDWCRRTLCPDLQIGPEAGRVALAAAVFELGLDMAETMPLLEAFLELPGDGRYPPVDAAAPFFKRQLIEVLVKVVAALARRRPTLLMVEDAHWIDPSSLEFLQQLQEQLPAARLLLLVTARPEFRPGWSYPQFVQINLDRLSRRERMAMVERLVEGRSLPALLLEEIVAKTDGIPLFVEELTKAVLDGGVLRGTASHEVGDTMQTAAIRDIPDTLQGSLMARLDRLDPEAREVAQVGATIGREFPTRLLARLAGRPAAELDAALARLAAAEIVVPAPALSFAGTSHVFRHTLIQEAAYQSLLLARRRQYHASLAEALETDFPEIASTQPEMIAQHWSAAQRVDEAIDWWRRAGERAAGRSAFIEACAHFQRGIDLAQRQPGANNERYSRTLPLMLARGDAEFKAATFPARSTYLECARLARRENLPPLMVAAALKYADSEVYLSSPSKTSVALLEDTLTAVGEEETLDRCRLLSQLGKALLSTGETERGREVLREARPMAERLDDWRSRYEILVSDLMPNGAPPPSGARIEERRRALASIWGIAEQFGSILKVDALSRTGAGFLEIGDIDEFERTVRLQEEVALATRANFDKWIVSNENAMRCIVCGAFADAERSSLDALEALSGHDVEFPLGVHGMQMFTIRREQGRLAEVVPLVKRFVSENPDDAVWRPGLMVIASDLGFRAQAERSFEGLAESGFALPLDSKRTVTLAYLAEVCARLGDAARAERIHGLLLPYRELAVVVPIHTICCGAAARYLGMLSTAMGDWPSAERHFELALALEQRMRAWPWLAHTRCEYAEMLLARGRPHDRVRAEELREMSLAAADRLGMGRLRQRILSTNASV
jgi:class 3 adenylate cyclase